MRAELIRTALVTPTKIKNGRKGGQKYGKKEERNNNSQTQVPNFLEMLQVPYCHYFSAIQQETTSTGLPTIN